MGDCTFDSIGCPTGTTRPAGDPCLPLTGKTTKTR